MRMMLSVPRRLWLALALFPGSAFALGLGEARLSSGLNQPLNAEIPLIAAAPDEIASLHAGLASRDAFARYGIDRPAFLSSVSLKVTKGADGRPVLLLRSSEVITEPFVTLLVEAGWNHGHLLREYTLLLDPPVFRDLPGTRAAADMPVMAPMVAPAAPSVGTSRATPEAASATSVVAAPTVPTSAGTDTFTPGVNYRVRHSDSALRIAHALGVTSRAQLDQTVVALFRGNPAAFAGNINRLRAGSTVRLPTSDEVAAVGQAEAHRELVEQGAAWRADRLARATGESAPEPVAAPASAAAPAPGRLRLVTPNSSSNGASQRPDSAKAAAAAVTAAAAAGSLREQQLQAELADTRRLLQVQSEQLARLQQSAASTATPAVVAPATAAAPPPATPPVAPPVAMPPAVVPAAAETSILDAFGGLSTVLLAGAGLLLAGGLGYGYLRRRREQAEDEFEVDADTREVSTDFGTTGTFPSPVRQKPAHMEVSEAPIRAYAPPVVMPRPPTRNAEDTLSGESALDLDKSDALTEANWHVAYGLYDQAADTLRLALTKEPTRRDLKLKLLEVYFVWGKPELFVELARELDRSRPPGATDEWANVVIMGQQIAPQDPLFVGASVKSAARTVDHDLEGGQGQVDVELFHSSLPASSDAFDGGGVDFDLDGAFPSLDFDTGADTGKTGQHWQGDSPTLEQPALRLADATLRQKLDMAGAASTRPLNAGQDNEGTDRTVEVSLADLDFDLGDADQLDESGVHLSPLEVTAQPGSRWSAPAGKPGAAPTGQTGGMGLEDELNRLALDLDGFPELDEDSAPVRAGLSLATGDTGELRFDEDRFGGGTTTSHYLPAATRDSMSGTDRMNKLDPETLSLEPVTLSEVGTKLDLARAYMDMGDPEGARSILDEVVAEGSASQQQEAKRLLGTLPG